MDQNIQLVDVSIMREDGLQPVVVRLAYSSISAVENNLSTTSFKVGDYIRGNIWLQANIYATNSDE